MKILRIILSIFTLLLAALFAFIFIVGISRDSGLLLTSIIALVIVVLSALAVRHYSYQKQLRWMRESEEYLAAKRAAKSDAKRSGFKTQ